MLINLQEYSLSHLSRKKSLSLAHLFSYFIIFKENIIILQVNIKQFYVLNISQCV